MRLRIYGFPLAIRSEKSSFRCMCQGQAEAFMLAENDMGLVPAWPRGNLLCGAELHWAGYRTPGPQCGF